MCLVGKWHNIFSLFAPLPSPLALTPRAGRHPPPPGRPGPPGPGDARRGRTASGGGFGPGGNDDEYPEKKLLN